MVKTPIVYGTTYFIFVLKTHLLQVPTYLLDSQNTLGRQYYKFYRCGQNPALLLPLSPSQGDVTTFLRNFNFIIGLFY